jgi:hypothetical protein
LPPALKVSKVDRDVVGADPLDFAVLQHGGDGYTRFAWVRSGVIDGVDLVVGVAPVTASPSRFTLSGFGNFAASLP